MLQPLRRMKEQSSEEHSEKSSRHAQRQKNSAETTFGDNCHDKLTYIT